MQALELIATLSTLLNLYFAAKNNLWTWLFGILAVSTYAIIFWQTKLYAYMSLQILFLLLQFNGLYTWRYGGLNRKYRLIHSTPHYAYVIAIIMTPLLFVFIASFLKHYSDGNSVMMDALVTSISLIAQWMFNMKWLENWYLWMCAMVISALICLQNQLYIVSFFNIVFFFFDFYAYFKWRQIKIETEFAKI